jgi:hypothetical protein
MPFMPPLKTATPQPKLKATRPAQPPAKKLALAKRDPRSSRRGR